MRLALKGRSALKIFILIKFLANIFSMLFFKKVNLAKKNYARKT